MDLEQIGRGRLADVFAWEEGKALKLYRSTERNDLALSEAAATSTLFAAGVPAPQCYGTMELNGRIGVILDRLGPDFGETVAAEGAEAMVALATLHTRIHAATQPGFQSLVKRLARRIAKSTPEHVVPAAIERLSQLPDGDDILHGDLHVYNAMHGAGGDLVAIDWNHTLRGSNHFGVARSHFLLLEADVVEMSWGAGPDDSRRELATRYLEEYGKLRQLDLDEVAAWRLPLLASRLTENIEAEREYLLDEISKELNQD